MSMHLVRPYITTTNYKKRKAKKKTKSILEAEARHNKWLRKIGAHPDQIAENKKKNGKSSGLSIPSYETDKKAAPTSDIIPSGNTAQKERQNYSGGRKLLGIAAMHKSNLVPVFEKEDAKDISNMRRD